MKLLYERREYEIQISGINGKLANFLEDLHVNDVGHEFKIIQENTNEIIFKHITYKRIGNTRIKINVINNKLILKIYEHYTAYKLHIYLIFVGVLGYFYGIIDDMYGALLFLFTLAYFSWILIDNYYDVKKSVIESIEKTISRLD